MSYYNNPDFYLKVRLLEIYQIQNFDVSIRQYPKHQNIHDLFENQRLIRSDVTFKGIFLIFKMYFEGYFQCPLDIQGVDQ